VNDLAAIDTVLQHQIEHAAREWLAAALTPESEADTRRKSARTMRAALLTNRPQNVITPEMY
jgi:hypothetical protein